MRYNSYKIKVSYGYNNGLHSCNGEIELGSVFFENNKFEIDFPKKIKIDLSGKKEILKENLINYLQIELNKEGIELSKLNLFFGNTSLEQRLLNSEKEDLFLKGRICNN
jgi:hypothetical protein